MADINLLPEDVKPKPYLLKLSKTLNKFVVGGFILFSFLVVVSLGSFLILRNRTQASLDRQEDLKAQVNALEQTEQRLFLLKDRLGKIGTVLSVNDAAEEVESLEQALNMSQGVGVFKDAEITKEKAIVTFSTDSSENLTRFLSLLIGSGEFKRIELASFGFSPSEGYELELGLVK